MSSIIMNHYFLVIIFFGIVGLMIGSFVNVIIYRLPIMLQGNWQNDSLAPNSFKRNFVSINLAWPSSFCPHCQNSLTLWQNIPILSYLLLLGKCGHCQKSISLRYPLVELLCAFVTMAWVHQLGFNGAAIAACLFSWTLIALFFIDIEHQLLPDMLTLPMLWVGLVVSTLEWFISARTAILGSLLGYCSFWLIAQLYRLVRKREGIGYGDLKLAAMLGAWIGWQLLPFVILLASILAISVVFLLLFKKKMRMDTAIPFGPFLAIAGWIVLFYKAKFLTMMQMFI